MRTVMGECCKAEEDPEVEMKSEESCFCSASVCGKAAMPASIAPMMKIKETMTQMTPQH